MFKVLVPSRSESMAYPVQHARPAAFENRIGLPLQRRILFSGFYTAQRTRCALDGGS